MHFMLQVALYLRDENVIKTYELIPSDIAILIILASHIGDKKYWYIDRLTIARECRLKKSQFTNRINHLQKLKLIEIKRTGKVNGYGINLPDIFEQIKQEKLEDESHSSGFQKANRVAFRKPIEWSLKVNISKHKKRGSKLIEKPTSLSDDFQPTFESIKTAKELGLTQNECDFEMEKFFNHYLENKKKYIDWQRILKNWFVRAAQYKHKRRK